MDKLDRFISIILPLENCQNFIESFIQDLIPILENNYYDYEVILVDDASTDNTVTIVSNLLKRYKALRLIRLSRHFGENIAISAGLDSVIGDYTIIMNPNTDHPNFIPDMVNRAIEGVDILYGVDINYQKKKGISSLLSKLFRWYVEKVIKLNIPKNLTSLRCLSRYAVNALTQLNYAHRYYSFSSSIIGFKSDIFEYKRSAREKYSNSQSFRTTFNNGLHIIVENSPHPLRFISMFSLGLATINLLYIFYIILIFLFKDHVSEGWTTLSMQISILFMCVILVLAAMSEYVGRLLEISQNKPPYYIKEERNSSVMLSNNRINVVENSKEIDLDKEVR
jgi:glycosyltransferase involved in cell wall biosynthesis